MKLPASVRASGRQSAWRTDRVKVGDIYRHAKFYQDSATGQLLPKFLIVLALPHGGDVVMRLLTSRNGSVRPRSPPCHHGNPYPGFYLGVLGGRLGAESWIDLRHHDDLDIDAFQNKLVKGVITLEATLAVAPLRAALECVAAADDTSRQQERDIRDAVRCVG